MVHFYRKRFSGERERLLIMEREKHLKAALDKLAGVRAIIRKRRTKDSLPTVAVVGYTNSGELHMASQHKHSSQECAIFTEVEG